MNCSSCGKPLSQSGSLTQWLGLGDFCKCQILFESDQGTSKNFDAICTYCGLHLNKNTGSITQWAFRRQTCNCLPALKKSLEPSKIALENIDDNSRRKPG
ncbi:MAG TPA: hypothetical protein PKZ32_05075, partial [Candidatus Melainabacteria bacterium]|nr:hypothetical protein [Candidatus Melainabacteria bacterium]